MNHLNQDTPLLNIGDFYQHFTKPTTNDLFQSLQQQQQLQQQQKDDQPKQTQFNRARTQQFQDDSQITKLFVGNLPTSTTLPELLAVFKKYGPVNEKLSVVKDQNYAFIHFYNRKDAQIALQEVNDSLFKDRYIRVQFSTSQGYTFNNKNKFVDKKRVFNAPQLPNQHLPHSMSTSSIFNQQNRNYRPIIGKTFNQQLNQQQEQQNQLMHLLYLAQLQQQQQKLLRSTTIDNFASLSVDLSIPSPSSSSSSNQTFLMPQFQSQEPTNSMIRSNTMFSFPNSFNLNR